MHRSDELVNVLEGELELRHGDQESMLEPGDAVYFDSGTPHSYQCAGKVPAKVIIVTMHQPPVAMPMRAASTSAAPRLVPVGSRTGGTDDRNTGNF